MSQPSAFSEQEREDLIAYLDGELEGEAARAIETRLALDPAARAEADSLKRTYELLDFLPKAEPSANFTHKTMSRIAPALTGLGATKPRRPIPWRLLIAGAGWAAALVVAALGGYYGYQRAVPREPGDKELVRDLRVIENKRLYELVEDIDFVHELDNPDLFGPDSPGS
jgi:anti-sigma factor RsiW